MGGDESVAVYVFEIDRLDRIIHLQFLFSFKNLAVDIHSREALSRMWVVIDVSRWVSVHMHEARFFLTAQLLFKLTYPNVSFNFLRS